MSVYNNYICIHCKIKHRKKIPKIVQEKLLPKFRNFFPLFYNRLHFRTFGILFQFDRKIISLSPAINSQHSEFSCPVNRIKFPNFGIKFRTIQKILVFGIFFRNYTNSLVAQTEQNFTIFRIYYYWNNLSSLSSEGEGQIIFPIEQK